MLSKELSQTKENIDDVKKINFFKFVYFRMRWYDDFSYRRYYISKLP